MEKKSEGKLEECKGNITLENRKKMILTGVEEVISFDDEKIFKNILYLLRPLKSHTFLLHFLFLHVQQYL